MQEDIGHKDTKRQRFLMRLCKSNNSTGNSAYQLMFSQNVRTRLELIVKSSEQSTLHTILHANKHRMLHPGDRVQALNYNKRGEKWSFRNFPSKEGNIIYHI